ncbi:MAG: hypothetical protein JWM11_2013 [Planctomycetaceae bacterium]|nr:hypothetical protein [Planctomycetaceae bacterium]
MRIFTNVRMVGSMEKECSLSITARHRDWLQQSPDRPSIFTIDEASNDFQQKKSLRRARADSP